MIPDDAYDGAEKILALEERILALCSRDELTIIMTALCGVLARTIVQHGSPGMLDMTFIQLKRLFESEKKHGKL